MFYCRFLVELIILIQAWNHDFFWESIKPGGGGEPSGELLELIIRDFGSFEQFAKEFKAAAATQFGSGWAWLVCKQFHHNTFFSLCFPHPPKTKTKRGN